MKFDPAWKFGTEVVEGNIKKAKCNYCFKVVWGISRLKQHLARVGKDVTGCPNVPSQVLEEMRNRLVQNRQKVDAHLGDQESLLKYAEDLGPPAQNIPSKKLKLLNLDQNIAHGFQAPDPHGPSSARRLTDDVKGKSVLTDRGSGKNLVSAIDMRPVGHFDTVGTISEGSAYISSLGDASGIQKSTDVVHGAVRENVGYPTHNQNQLVLQQQNLPPSNTAIINTYTVHPPSQVPISYEARPMQIAYPWVTIKPSKLRAMCHASGLGYGVWGGQQFTQLGELQCNANPALLGQGFQQTLHNSHTQLQNQLRLEAGEVEKTLPLLDNMFNEGTSSTVQNCETTSNASRNGQQVHLTGINLELQLRTKPPSP